MALQVSPRPVGRPKGSDEFEQRYCDDILPLAEQGMGIEEICAELGFSCQSFYRWMESHEDFRNAAMRAKELCLSWWMKFGRENLLVDKEHRMSERNYALHMMNRFDWNKKQDVNVHGSAAAITAVEDYLSKQNAKAPDAGKSV